MRKRTASDQIGRVLIVLLAGGVCATACGASAAHGASVTLWREAVVTGDEVHVTDVGQLAGLPAADWTRVADLVVIPAPDPGGSAIVSCDDLRRTLQAAGVNLAEVVIKGAAHCDVRRPQQSSFTPAAPSTDGPPGANGATFAGRSLRQAIESFLAANLGQTSGRVEVQFGRTSGGVLELSEPDYQFDIKRTSGQRLGIVSLEVAVLADGEIVQQVPLLLNVSFVKPTVVAAQAINMGATLAASDVRVVEMTFTRLEHMGVEEPAVVVGQRARRFIGAGQVVMERDLEVAPLVKRGQIVSVYSQVGGVSIVTAAKAMTSGAYGEAVELRASDRSKEKFTATVSGPGRVRVAATSPTVVALGGDR